MIQATLYYKHGVTHTLHIGMGWTLYDIARALEKCQIEKAVLELEPEENN